MRSFENIQSSHLLCGAVNEVFEREIVDCGVLEMGTYSGHP
jgi:hypothetical protein